MASELTNALRYPRRRASVACLQCRARKVRCDVARFGSPCSNCRLDDDKCVVRSRRETRRHALLYHSGGQAQEPTVPAAADPAPASANPSLGAILEQSPAGDEHQNTEPLHVESLTDPTSMNLPGLEAGENDLNETDSEPAIIACESHADQLSPEGRKGPGDVLYTYYQFLRGNQFSHLSAREFCLLDTQSCLRVPTRVILDEFVQQYFLYMHPLLPLLDEADFCRRYQDGRDAHEEISLLLIQAMLFAACHCVSAETISALGFSSSRAARAELYRRAKTLHEMNAECSSLVRAQAALLLSFWTPPGEPKGQKPNTSWLASAIQQAREENAHLYYCWPHYRDGASRRTLWKKIWWCCIIRDRALSLGLRRPPQITRDTFDFASCELLTEDDFNDDIKSSRVYGRQAKRLLTHVLLRIVELCSILTDLHSISLWLESPGRSNAELLPSNLTEVQRLKSSLRAWREETDAVFSLSLQRRDLADREAAIVHLHAMYLYYYSATISLSHHEILLATMVIPTGSAYGALKTGYTSAILNEIRDTSACVAECLDSLSKPGLIRLLPISTVAFLAMPLIQHILDRHPTSDDTNAKAIRRGNRLDVLIKAMKVFHSHYDGVDWLSSVIRKALNSEEQAHSAKDKTFESGGLEQPPVRYLHIAFVVDFGLSRSRYAETGDIPDYLEELFQEKPVREEIISTGSENGTDIVPTGEQFDLDYAASERHDFFSTDQMQDACTITPRLGTTTASDDFHEDAQRESLNIALADEGSSVLGGIDSETHLTDEEEMLLLKALLVDQFTAIGDAGEIEAGSNV